MKANGSKRKIFDAVDMMTADAPQAEIGNGLQTLPVDKIKPFHDHPFHLYEGERLDDMVESIREHGVLNPVIVRKKGRSYEMLSGHNRQNAARIAGLSEIPAIVKEGLSDEEAYVYVIETNVIQRSFTDLAPSEKAAVLSARYEKVISQGRRNDILQEIEEIGTCGHDVHKSRSRDGIGEEYGMTGRNIARYMRVNKLIRPFKDMADFEAYALGKKKSYDASIDEVETLRKKHEGMMEQLSEAENKVRELNRMKAHESFAVTKLTAELLDEYVEDIQVHPGDEVRIIWK